MLNDNELYLQISKNDCPMHLLRAGAVASSHSIRLFVAKHPRCPKAAFWSLYRNYDEEIQTSVIKNIKCPADILSTASRSFSYWTRQAVAENYRCPVHILSNLRYDLEYTVLIRLIRNKKVPVEWFDDYMLHPNDFVRLCLLRSYKCPRHIARALLNDSSEMIRTAALETRHILKKDRVAYALSN